MKPVTIAADGSAIRTLRYSKGLRMRELASQVGVNHSVISRLENGHASGSPPVLLRIATALGVTVADITKATAPTAKNKAFAA